MLVSGRLMLRSLSPSTPPTLASNHSAGVAKVVLKKGKTQLFKDGSPMVYSGAVDRVIGRPPPITGDIVLVADGSEKPIGWGFYNSTSMFRVRLMQLQDEDPSCALNAEKLLETRIVAAVKLRHNLGLPSAHTNAYRLVNSEGDRLSGLIVDIFGDLAVIASSAAWVQTYQHQIMDCLSRLNNIKRISWRPTVEILKEEGLDLSDLKKPDLIIPQTMVKDQNTSKKIYWKLVWRTRQPLRVTCFIWTALKEACLTQDNLRRRGVIVVNMCAMCKQANESVNHLFLHCPAAARLWYFFYSMLGLQWAMPFNIKDAYASWILWRVDKSIKRIWRMIPAVIFWNLWKERNSRCFEGISTPICSLKSRCLATLYSWHFFAPVNSVGNFLDFVSSLSLVR
ncbi:uncharacterized protein LOC132616913 isoform X2 [Lycium barbarum]|uniref:uncharacterized protein LOC132616913 isoform X2 n=1 Tax=Lycium barbarum TaxID=112863 RepID=UPI00293EDD66|nr:uncharacterized protein LOC132616913 isoform X2 [Lycium barbarum]